jgi:hypothetical protein
MPLNENDWFCNNGKLSNETVHILERYLDKNLSNNTIKPSENVTKWIENTPTSPSFNTPIGEKYNEKLRLQVIGDISVDLNGSIEFTEKVTTPDNPVFLYDLINKIKNAALTMDFQDIF